MPAYHSEIENVDSFKTVGNLVLLPIKTSHKGPAPRGGPNDEDIIDEAMKYYRANVFFKHYEIKSASDRVLIYITLFIQACITTSQKSADTNAASKVLNTLALANFSMPGDPRFPLNSLYSAPTNRGDSDTMRNYLQQIRLEVTERFLATVFADNAPDK
eukprot:Awhi_evm1s15288